MKLVKKITVSQRGDAIVSFAVVGHDGIYVADRDGDMLKVDRTTLRVAWSVPSNGLRPMFVVAEDLLIAGSLLDATIGRIETRTGGLLWAHPAMTNSVTPWQMRLVVAGDTISLVEPTTGQLVLQRTIEQPTDAVAICGGRLLYMPKGQGDPLHAITLPECDPLWTRPILREMKTGFDVDMETNVIGLVAGGDGRFIACRGGAVFGCSLDDGRILWCARIPVPYHRPNVHDGRVYVFFLNRAIAIDEAAGTVLYEIAHPELARCWGNRRGVIYGDRIAFCAETGHLAVFRLADGTLVWSYQHKAPLWHVAEADGRLLVSTGDGQLLVFGGEG